MENLSVYIEEVCEELVPAHRVVLTKDAITFVAELFMAFKDRIEELHHCRRKVNLELMSSFNPSLVTGNAKIRQSEWKIHPPPRKLQNRFIDLGDVSPSNIDHLVNALNSEADGIQIDFDDGHCPSWKNEIMGHYNIYRLVRQELPNAPPLVSAPALMFRPRAWNMTEYHMTVNGVSVPGAIFDFGIHMFHNGLLLHKAGVGPYFYLSKLESSSESKLWNDIFIATQKKLLIPQGTIKACVLIENILAAFQMEEILYTLKEHSIGLNCGVWDYCASIICKFGRNRKFLIPDRNKYVDVEKHFLKKYMELTVRICHKRGTIATSGMATALMNSEAVAIRVCEIKRKELRVGFDGFLLYDHRIVPYTKFHLESEENRRSTKEEEIFEADLLQMPDGGVTLDGLRHNITVAILFFSNWFNGNGHFEHNGAIEDSATAEISRWQVWQWLLHEIKMENSDEKVSLNLVRQICLEITQSNKRLTLAANIFMEIVTLVNPPEFITTYLSNSYLMRNSSAILSHL